MFHVHLFAVLRDAAGRDALEIADPRPELSLPELLLLCEEACPALGKYLPHVRVALDCEYAMADARARPEQEIALLPPVAGGSS